MKKNHLDPILGKGIELQQIVGTRRGSRSGNPIVVRKDVDFIRRDGQVIGVISRHTDCIPCIHTPMEQEECEELHKEITKIRVALGKWIPKQSGKMWAQSPSSKGYKVESLVDGRSSDDRLMEEARQRYGLDIQSGKLDIESAPESTS